jgi:hypothetical protein
MIDRRAVIVGAGATSLAALLDQKDAGAILAHVTLSDLVRLEHALGELLPIIRQTILEGERAAGARAAIEVPLVGAIAPCDAGVVHQVLAYARDSRNGLTVVSATLACPAHVLAHLARARHAITPVAPGDRHGDTSVSILPLPLAENVRCGDFTDFTARGRESA